MELDVVTVMVMVEFNVRWYSDYDKFWYLYIKLESQL